MVVTHQVPGTISREMVLLQDGFTTPISGVNPTLSLLATTTLLENTNHAVPQSQLLHAKSNAQLATLELTPSVG